MRNKRIQDRDPIQHVMTDPSLVTLITSFLRYDYLKDCRMVNKLWRFVVTKIVRSKTRVCVNEENLNVMLYGSTVLGLSLHIRWGPFIRIELATLLQKYCRYIESLSWFLDRSEKDALERFVSWQMNHLLTFPSVKKLYIIVSKTGFSIESIMALISTVLKKSPNLEALRLEVLEDNFTVTEILCILKLQSPSNLKSLHFGKGVQLKVEDFKIIKSLRPQLETFIWEAQLHSALCYQQAIQGEWLQSLRTVVLKSPPRLCFTTMLPVERLSIEGLDFGTNVQLTSNFPHLIELSFTIRLGYNWEHWIPKNMDSHHKITSLNYTSKKLDPNARKCLLRLFAKLPNLAALQCPSDDEFLHKICERLPTLKRLNLHGNCTDYGVTGLSRTSMNEAIKILEYNSLYHVKQNVMERFRVKANICNLKYLEDLTFMHTEITDLIVTLAISQMKNLKRLYITGISLNAVLQLLAHPCLIEIGVPQPLEGKISYEEIALLQRTTPHIKIISGWDANAFQSE